MNEQEAWWDLIVEEVECFGETVADGGDEDGLCTGSMLGAIKDYADKCVSAAVTEARAPLVEALGAVEWVTHGCEYEKNSWCPQCERTEHDGHNHDCPLAAAIAKETP